MGRLKLDRTTLSRAADHVTLAAPTRRPSAEKSLADTARTRHGQRTQPFQAMRPASGRQKLRLTQRLWFQSRGMLVTFVRAALRQLDVVGVAKSAYYGSR